MATELEDKAHMEEHEEEDNNGYDLVSIDLPAPHGWTKKFVPKKGGTPRRNEIVFIAPSGEEIKNKRQLDQYLKSHPGGPSASEFDWGTGDTPRRSARLSSKPKVTETPESVPSGKRQKKSSSKKDDKNDETNGEGESAEDEAAANKIENAEDVEMKDAEVAVNHSKEEKANETGVNVNSAEAPVENIEEKTDRENKQAQKAGGAALSGETTSQANAIKSDAELQESNNVAEEQPGEAKHACNNEITNAMEEQPKEAKDVRSDAVEEQPVEAKEAADNEMEEQLRGTKEAPSNATGELLGENKDIPGVKLAEDRDVPAFSANASSVEKDVNEAVPVNAGTETADSKPGPEGPAEKQDQF